jgi:RNA-directed DNA polymerase
MVWPEKNPLRKKPNSVKRASGLFERIVDPENFRLALYKASRYKRDRKDVRLFMKQPGSNLMDLRDTVINGRMNFSNYTLFTVNDTKKRLICAADFRSRIVQHALMNICDPVFERYQIFDSYASRRKKGTFAALARAREFSGTYPWFLKLDVRKYFDSIDHGILKEQLVRLFKDRALLDIFSRIIDSYCATPGRGLPIGNLTSQYFANHTLAGLDHAIKEQLRIKGYVRYMDDMVLWGVNTSELMDCHTQITCFLKEKLRLNLKPECCNTVQNGVPFLGFRIFKDTVRLRSGSKKRFRGKYKTLSNLLAKERISDEEFGQRSLALVAHIEYAQSRGFRRTVLF